MKAKAWFIALLIGMIGLVGFGLTTSDLDQNSADIVTVDNVGDMQVVLVAPSVGVEFVHQANKGAECLKEPTMLKAYSHGNLTKADYKVGWQNKSDTINYNNRKELTYTNGLIYRRARDGLRTIKM